jgi:hypothetical protein
VAKTQYQVISSKIIRAYCERFKALKDFSYFNKYNLISQPYRYERKATFTMNRITEKLWFRPLIFCLLSILER